jgi:endonuclease YncB( thermonuclease family)
MIPGIKTPRLSLCGFTSTARVVDVHDGDTITLVIPIFESHFKFSTRINGIDTCELHGSNAGLALAAKARVFQLLAGTELTPDVKIKDYFENNYTTVIVVCADFDKYGRLLAGVVSASGVDIAKTLVLEKLATPYSGGTKLNESIQATILGV